MAFNEQEKQIVIFGKQSGKSTDEISNAIARYRAGITTQPETPVETKPTYFEQVKEAAQSSLERAKSGVELATTPSSETPLNVPLGATRAASGVIGAAFSPLAPLFKPIAEGFAKLTDFISNTKPFQEFGEGTSDMPADKQTGAEQVLELTANIADIAGTIAGGRAIPAVAKTTVGTFSKGTELLGGITKTGTEGIREATAGALDPAQIMQRVARISKSKQAQFQAAAGESVGEYLVKRGIFGDVDKLTEQLYTRFQQSKGQVDDALASLPGTYKTTPIGNALKQLAQREQRISSPGALSKDLERVRELLKKHNRDGLSMEEINEVKRLFERNVRLDYVKENVPDKVEMSNNIDSAIRTWQQSKASELGFKNIQELNRETRLSKQLLDDLGAEYAGSAGNNAITLTDWIILAGGDPTAVGGFLAKRALSSKGVMSKVAQMRAPSATVKIPEALFGEPTIDGFAKWIKSIEGRATKPTQ